MMRYNLGDWSVAEFSVLMFSNSITRDDNQENIILLE